MHTPLNLFFSIIQEVQQVFESYGLENIKLLYFIYSKNEFVINEHSIVFRYAV